MSVMYLVDALEKVLDVALELKDRDNNWQGRMTSPNPREVQKENPR
jgi:hypothetical protein